VPRGAKLKRNTRSIFNLPVYKEPPRLGRRRGRGAGGGGEGAGTIIADRDVQRPPRPRILARGRRRRRFGVRKDFAGGSAAAATFRSHRQKGNRLTAQKYTDIYEGRDIRANLREIIIYRLHAPPIHQGVVF